MMSPSSRDSHSHISEESIEEVSKEESGSDMNLQPMSPSSFTSISRRKVITTAMAGLSAEAGWRRAIALAATIPPATTNPILPPGTIETIESGRAAIIHNWLTPAETSALAADVQRCFTSGHFTNFILSRNPNKADQAANDRWIMPSFSRARGSSGIDGPFA